MRNKRVKLWSTVIAAMVLQSSFGLASRAAWPSLGGLAPLAGSGIVSLAAPGELTAVRSAEPISIDSLRLREFEDGEEIQIQASGDIVWTQYRDDRGDLVIELPNTVVADQVSGLDSGGLISSIEIETLPEGERPLTRLVIATSEQSEHSLNVFGDVLLLQFVAQGGAFEPLAVSAPDPQQEPGTPEEPAHGPPPTGVSATQLQGVEVLQAGPEPVIRILGDGEFAYSTFSLADPPRFVIDLEGVVNTSSESTVYVDSPFVDQVRMAQFRPYPQPIARVVLDLRSGLFPVIERDSDGLTLRFEEASVVASEPLDELQADESEVAETQPQDRAVTLAEGPDEQALDEPEQLRTQPVTQPVTQPIVEAADLAEIETTAPGAEASSPDDPVDGALQSETLVPLSPQDAEPETT